MGNVSDKPGWNPADTIFAIISIILFTIFGGPVGFILSVAVVIYLFIDAQKNQ